MVAARGIRDDGRMEDTTPTPNEEHTLDTESAVDVTIDEGSEQNTDGATTASQTEDIPEPHLQNRWRRPRDGRVVAGVAAGIAQHTDIPAWLVRVLFVLTSFAGGFGVAAYLAGWAVMPGELETEAAADRWRRQFENTESTSQKVGIALIVLAVLIVLGSTGVFASPLALAAVLVVAGIALTRPKAA